MLVMELFKLGPLNKYLRSHKHSVTIATISLLMSQVCEVLMCVVLCASVFAFLCLCMHAYSFAFIYDCTFLLSNKVPMIGTKSCRTFFRQLNDFSINNIQLI